MRRLVAEAVGTFALVLFGTGSMVLDQQTDGGIGNFGIALTFGVTVTAMIYFFKSTSGAHINPAVSLAFWSHGKLSGRLVIPYILSQVAGGLLASLVLKSIFPTNEHLGATLPSVTQGKAFIIEFLLTFILMMVILVLSQGSANLKRFAAAGIGFTVFLEAYFAGPFTGASMNPARSLAPAIISGNLDSLWIYIIATISGAWIAVKAINELPAWRQSGRRILTNVRNTKKS